MPLVHIPALLAGLTGGRSLVEVPGTTVREVIDNLERAWPGLRERLVDQDRLRPNIRVSVDGRISRLGLLEGLSPSSEIHFVAAISGGAAVDSRSDGRDRSDRTEERRPGCAHRRKPCRPAEA